MTAQDVGWKLRIIRYLKTHPRLVIGVSGIILIISRVILPHFAYSDIIKALLGEMGAILIAVALLGLALEYTEWSEALRSKLADILTDPKAVREAGFSEEELKRRMNGIITALHKGAEPPESLLKAIHEDVVADLSLPIRKDWRLTWSFEDINRPELVKLRQTVKYTLVRSRQTGGYIFGGDHLVNQGSVELTPLIKRDMEQGGVATEDLIGFEELSVNGEVLREGQDYSEEWEFTEEEVYLRVICDRQFPSNAEEVTIEFTNWLVVEKTDVHHYRVKRITKGLRAQVLYDNAVIPEVFLLAQIPHHWDVPTIGQEEHAGLVELEIDKYLLPGHSILLFWRDQP